ncbi:MAG: zinc-binding dehydrogenase, partial [bacterium]|nr:zinc-binding dehydrogenase [bacterium]
EPNLVKRIKELTNGGVDVSIEATGTPENLHLAYESLRPGGRLVVIGYPLSHTTFHLGRLMYRELEILGSAGCRASDMERLIELVAEGKIDTHPLVTATFPLEEINEAFSFVREGSSLKTVIVPTKEIN